MGTPWSAAVTLGAMLAFLTSISAGEAMGGSSAQASLAGSWIVNPDESDDPRAKIESALQSERRERRRGSQQPELDPNVFLARVRDMEQLLESLSVAPDELAIEVASGEVHVIASEAGRIRIFYLDGRKHIRQTPSGSQLETLAQWDGRRLVVEQDAGDGDTVNEVYALGSDPSVLIVDFRLKLDRLEDPIVVRTVYDRLTD